MASDNNKEPTTNEGQPEPTIDPQTDQPTPPSGPTTTDEPVQMSSPYQEMLKREYDYAVEQEIQKGTRMIRERFARLLSQEKTPTDVAVDNLGNSSDDYERMVNAIQGDNPQALAADGTREGLYEMLYSLDFTQMRKLEAIKQEYKQT